MGVRRGVAALLLLGVLVSCSEDEPSGPSGDPGEPTSAVSSSPSPTETDSELVPAEARGADEASARAFVRFWFATFSRAMTSGDLTLLRELSTLDCASCQALMGAVKDVYRRGGSFRTTGWTVELITRAPGYTGSAPDFLLRTRHARRDLLGKNGSIVDREPRRLVAMRVLLSREAGDWRVRVLEELR